MFCGNVVLFGGVVFQIKQLPGSGRVARLNAGKISRRILFVRGQNRHAIRPARIEIERCAALEIALKLFGGFYPAVEIGFSFARLVANALGQRLNQKFAEIRKRVTELLAENPEVIVGSGGTTTALLLQATDKIPIIFTTAVDPVGNGFVDSLSHPGRNATGFMQFDYSLSAKWLELLKQISPAVVRVGVIRDATTPSGIGQFAVLQSVARSFAVDIFPIGTATADEIEAGIVKLASGPNAGLVATLGAALNAHRDLIVRAAARHRLPAVYANRVFVDRGGLISYGSDTIESSRRAAAYVDRILKGEKPADLPVQAPNKYDLVVNLKTARSVGLDLPATLIARADEVIE